MIRFTGRAARSIWYGLWILAFLIGVPWALTRFVGWPLPRTMPDAERVADWLENPLESHRAIKLLAILIWLLFGFLVYAIITSPDRAADIVQAVWDIIAQEFTNIGQFFQSLLE